MTIDDAAAHDEPAARADDPEADEGAPVGFLELFYDLVFVAATIVVSNTFASDLSWGSAFRNAIVFTLLWVLWFHTTLLMNVERRDDFGHRALVLAQMFGITLTVLAYADKATTNNDLLGITFGAVVLLIAVMYHRAGTLRPEVHDWTDRRRDRLVVAAALVVITTWLPDVVDDLVFLLALVVFLVPSKVLHRRSDVMPRIDVHHLTERAALLTLIVMGETFVKVSLTISQGFIDRDDVVAMVVQFVAVFALWIVYFDDIPRAGIRHGITGGEAWSLAHLVLQLGIVAFAVGVSKFLQVEEGGVHHQVVVILVAAFVMVYGGLALIGLLGRRRPIGPLTVARLAVVAAALVVGTVTWVFEWFTPFQFLVVLAVVEVVHAAVATRLRQATTVPELH